MQTNVPDKRSAIGIIGGSSKKAIASGQLATEGGDRRRKW
jgi:hypothetical protein